MSLQRRFEEETRELLRVRNSTALVLGAFLFPLFTIQDRLVAPESADDLLLLRLTSALVCVLCMAINKTGFGRRSPFAVTMIALVTLSLLKTATTPRVMEDVTLLYFAGHVLILIGAMSFLPLSLKQALLVGVTVQLCYVLPLVLTGRDPAPVAFFVQNGYTLCVWFMLALNCHIEHSTRRREFVLRCKLYTLRQTARIYSASESGPALACAEER